MQKKLGLVIVLLLVLNLFNFAPKFISENCGQLHLCSFLNPFLWILLIYYLFIGGGVLIAISLLGLVFGVVRRKLTGASSGKLLHLFLGSLIIGVIFVYPLGRMSIDTFLSNKKYAATQKKQIRETSFALYIPTYIPAAYPYMESRIENYVGEKDSPDKIIVSTRLNNYKKNEQVSRSFKTWLTILQLKKSSEFPKKCPDNDYSYQKDFIASCEFLLKTSAGEDIFRAIQPECCKTETTTLSFVRGSTLIIFHYHAKIDTEGIKEATKVINSLKEATPEELNL